MTFKRNSIFPWLIVLLAFVPALLFAYLGQFSRMIADDACFIIDGQERGAWGGLLYWYNRWGGGYTDYFIKSALGPLDTLAPAMMPPLIVALWLVGLSWLVFQGLACLRIDNSRWALAVSIAALAVAAAINAFFRPESFYWYSASVRYTLPIALFTIYMALAIWTAQRLKRLKGDMLSLLGLIAGGMLCFISAGASEMFVVFQTTFLTLCLLAIFAFPRHGSYLLSFGMGWLTTLAGLTIQLNSPGAAVRAEYIMGRDGQPERSILILVSETLNQTFEHIANPQVFLGFVMLISLGLLVMLLKYKPQASPKASKPVELTPPSLWLCLIVQLLFIPILWGHTSDDPQWLGRFSSGYMAVILLNIAFILSLPVLLWQRERINAQLQKQERGLLIIRYAIAFTLILVLLFAFMHLGSMHYRASVYLFTSSLVFFGIITRQLLSVGAIPMTRKFGSWVFCSYGFALVACIAIVFASLFGSGDVKPRILTVGAYLLVLAGLIWGAYIGYLVKNYLPSSQASQAWIRFVKLGSLAIILLIGSDMVLGQVALIPNFQIYAQEWDARHQEIIAQREDGQTHIEVSSLRYNLANYVEKSPLARQGRITNRCAIDYYDVESIVVTEG